MKFARYILILLTTFTLSVNEAKSQIDTSFWFAAPWVTPDHWWRDPIAFHISTFNNPTTVHMYQPAATYDTTFVVPANTLFSKYVHFMMNQLENKPANTVLNRGFKFETDFPVTIVYDIITRGPQFNNPETYSLKGQNGKGTEFVVPFQTIWRNNPVGDLDGDGIAVQPKQMFVVVATEDNTTIYITPRCAVVGHPANVTYSVVLPQKGMTYTCENVTQLTNTAGNSLAGSIVVADKPIQVTVSDDSVNPAGGGGCYDLMGDQIVPTDVIGNEYIINRGFLNAGSNESIFVVATENFTNVSINNGVTTTTTILNQGDTYPYSITQPLTYVNTSKPVYLLHMSGYGCELGEALLPPLNCAGSDQVVFARANSQSFLLNVLCQNGDQGSFQLNGNPTLIPAAAFTAVPGTGGAWVGAQISFTTAQVPVGSANLVTNSGGLFALGVINGGATTGCLYHYMSSFIRRVFTKAGNDTILCNGDPSVALNGSITGGTTTGIWTVLNGTGNITNPTDLTTNYAPSTSDYAQGTVTFVLSSTGNCLPVSDTMKIDFIQSPVVTTGSDNTFCKNNIGTINISGTLQFAAGASWTSSGTGGAFGNPGNLNTTYTPSPSDLANDSVALYLTSAGSFFSCPNDKDTLIIRFTDPPQVFAGADMVICSNTQQVTLNGSVTGSSSTGQWTTTGAGAFSPGNVTLTTDYLISSTDTAVGFLTVTLTSTNNGNCNAVEDSLQIQILDKPDVDITSSDTVCANLASFALTGTVSAGFSTTWSTTNGVGFILSPGSLNTTYNISPIDTTQGFIDIFLTTSSAICPSEYDSVRVTFAEPPRVNAGTDQAFCNNQVIQLNGQITGVTSSGFWSSTGTGQFIPGTNFAVTTYHPSTQDLTMSPIYLILTSTNNFGCNPDDDTLIVTFKPSPVADFSNTTACQGSNTNFTDLSTTTAGTINSWTWDFGDFSGGSVAPNPIHPYSGSGNFLVSLIAGSSNGCYDTITYPVTVNPLPVAAFTFNPPCQGMEIDFIDQSFISSGGINQWNWTFGDLTPNSNQQNPIHIYDNTGTYPVILQVTSLLGCTDTAVINASILPRPNAEFSVSPNPVVVLENTNFTDMSTGNGISGWYWNFGDSLGTNTQNPVHNYANGGVYGVYLVVTDANGCIDTAYHEVIVALLPVLPTAFTPNGDGENDVFIIRGGPFKATDFKVYNNWGQVIFQTNDANIGWDGTFKGVDQPLGVYTWTFAVEIANGRVIQKSGDVTLLR